MALATDAKHQLVVGMIVDVASIADGRADLISCRPVGAGPSHESPRTRPGVHGEWAEATRAGAGYGSPRLVHEAQSKRQIAKGHLRLIVHRNVQARPEMRTGVELSASSSTSTRVTRISPEPVRAAWDGTAVSSPDRVLNLPVIDRCDIGIRHITGWPELTDGTSLQPGRLVAKVAHEVE